MRERARHGGVRRGRGAVHLCGGVTALGHTVSHREPHDYKDLFRVQSKRYDPQLREGQSLAFQLRVNPVIKKSHENGKQRAHDVVMNAKWEMRQDGTWEDCELTEAQLAQREGERWLQRRTEHYGYNFAPDQVRVESHRKHSFRKSSNGRRVTFTTMDFVGQLVVTDPERFREEALFSGMGPSKAYGCGLLMVRPL